MRGSYKYAPLKLMIAKIIKSTPGVPGDKPCDELAFLDGDYMCYQHAHVEVPRLSAGEYVIFFKAEWSSLNPQRKLIMNIYAPDPIDMIRVPNKQFPVGVYLMMDEWLNKRLLLGQSYDVPVMSAS